MKLAISLLALALFVQGAFGAQYIVGDSNGWTLPSGNGNVNYTAWALMNNYHPGDTLLFNYQSGLHSVLEVNRADFTNCVKSNSINHHSNGNTVIRISRPGPHWFICGIPGHCEQGQKFGIMATPSNPGSGVPSPTTSAPSPSPKESSPHHSAAPSSTPSSSSASSSHHSHHSHAPSPAPTKPPHSSTSLSASPCAAVFLVAAAAFIFLSSSI